MKFYQQVLLNHYYLKIKCWTKVSLINYLGTQSQSFAILLLQLKLDARVRVLQVLSLHNSYSTLLNFNLRPQSYQRLHELERGKLMLLRFLKWMFGKYKVGQVRLRPSRSKILRVLLINEMGFLLCLGFEKRWQNLEFGLFCGYLRKFKNQKL